METNNRSLVQIIKDHFVMDELLNALAGELDQTTESWLEENKENLSKKADNYKTAMDMLEAAEGFLKSKAEPFSDAAKVCKNKREALKERLKWAMMALDMHSIEGDNYIFTLSPGANKLVIENEETIPAKFFKEEVVLSIDKDAIKAALESGEKIPGAKLEQIQSLRSKVNATTVRKIAPKKGKKDAQSNSPAAE